MKDFVNNKHLPLPEARCLTTEQAAAYLGIGKTLFIEIGPPAIHIGRRTVYDKKDLDFWLEKHKVDPVRERANCKEKNLWPEKKDSTDEKTPRTGGSMSFYQTEIEYEEALDTKS